MMTTLSQSSGTPALEPTHPVPDIRRGAFFAFSAPVSGTKSSPRASDRRKIRSARQSNRRRKGFVTARPCTHFCHPLRCHSVLSPPTTNGQPTRPPTILPSPALSPPHKLRDI